MSTETLSSTGTVRITRTFNAPAAAVWKAWTDEATFKRWWGPERFTCPSATLDVRVGGKFLAAMRDANGTDTWSTGTYREVVPQQRLVYTDHFADAKGNVITPEQAGMPGRWPEELVVTVTFAEKNGRTEMDLQHAGIPREAMSDCTEGWSQCIDKMERAVEKS